MRTHSCSEVLCIEDSPADARLLRFVLGKTSVALNLTFAYSGEEGLTFLEQMGKNAFSEKPDLILLDINLPGLDGLEILALLKSHPFWRNIPVIILSTSSSPEDLARAGKLAVDEYVTKPFSPDGYDRLITLIEMHLSPARLYG